MRIFVLFFTLIAVSGFSKNSGDTLLPKNSVRMDIAGKAFGGIGFVYERNLRKKYPEKYPRAYTSFETGISYPFVLEDPYLMPGIGINRNWSLSHTNRIYLIAGLYGCALISLNPTPKAIREMYDSTHFYGGRYVNPVEPYLFGDIGIKIFFHHFFTKICFTPVLRYDRIIEDRFYVFPWGGVSIGIIT